MSMLYTKKIGFSAYFVKKGIKIQLRRLILVKTA